MLIETANSAFIKRAEKQNMTFYFLTNLFHASPDELYPSFPHGKRLSFLFKNLSYYLKKDHCSYLPEE